MLWFPKKYRSAYFYCSIVVVGVFVNSLVQLVGILAFLHGLSTGFLFLLSPNFEPNWLFTKDAWWFFGHPIVYSDSFLISWSRLLLHSKICKENRTYDKWAYRSWPFYFIFQMDGIFSPCLPPWIHRTLYGFKYYHKQATFAIVFPSGLTIITVMMYLFVPEYDGILLRCLCWLVLQVGHLEGFAGPQTGWWGTNVYLHNTLNVVGHIHLVILTGSVLFGLGLIYSIVPSITKKNFGKTLGSFIYCSL